MEILLVQTLSHATAYSFEVFSAVCTALLLCTLFE